MKKFIFLPIVLLLSSVFILYASSTPTSLIIIRGTANSGKSTLCKTLNKLLNNSYAFVSQDDIHRKESYKAFKSIFPEEMKLICETIPYKNLWQTIKYGVITFPDNTEEQKKEAIQNAVSTIQKYFDNPCYTKQKNALDALGKQKVMHQLLFHATQRHNVIFDSWGVTNWDYELNQLKNYFDHLIGVVTYCSLKTVKQRWKHRNSCARETNDYTEVRTMTQMIKSFFSFLQPNDSNLTQNINLLVTKQEFDTLMQKMLLYISNNTTPNAQQKKSFFSIQEFTAEELLEFKNTMYEKFHFDKQEQTILMPSITADILLCTEGDCDTYTAELLKKIFTFYSSTNININVSSI